VINSAACGPLSASASEAKKGATSNVVSLENFIVFFRQPQSLGPVRPGSSYATTITLLVGASLTTLTKA
jgi:hypothetical protein